MLSKKYFLKGEKVGLRALEESDLTEKYFQWLNDEEGTQYTDQGIYPNNWKKFCSFYESMKGSKDNVFLGIFWLKNNKHVGNVKLGPINWIHRNAIYSILIGEKNYWGKGVCTETTLIVCRYAFEALNLNRVQLGVIDKNVAAIKSYKKAGFEVEGVFKKYFWTGSEYHDSICMAILREDYFKKEF